jgi:hypothetical protein
LGSDREIRGKIIRLVLRGDPVRGDDVYVHIQCEKERTERILEQMIAEGLLVRDRSGIRIS